MTPAPGRRTLGTPRCPALSAFVAIDFETASHEATSACAVGLVRVENGAITARAHHLIRPPSDRFFFTYIHGLTWNHVKDAPTFADLWPEIARMLQGARFLAAHNAPFDRGVLNACCALHDLPAPKKPYVCTVRLARATWNIRPTRLPDVCRHLGLELRHHEALSDAEACAGIVIRAQGEGWRF